MLGVFKSDKDKSLNDPLITAEEGRAGQGKAKESSTVDYSVSSSPADTGDPTNGQGLTDGQVLSLRAEWGENTLPENKKSKLYLLLLAFTSPMACLIWVTTLIEQPQPQPQPRPRPDPDPDLHRHPHASLASAILTPPWLMTNAPPRLPGRSPSSSSSSSV